MLSKALRHVSFGYYLRIYCTVRSNTERTKSNIILITCQTRFILTSNASVNTPSSCAFSCFRRLAISKLILTLQLTARNQGDVDLPYPLWLLLSHDPLLGPGLLQPTFPSMLSCNRLYFWLRITWSKYCSFLLFMF